MPRLHHVSIAFPPGGYDAVREFYTGVLGMTEIEVPPGQEPDTLVWFHGGSGDLEVHLYQGEVRHSDQHLCLAVEDLDALHTRLERGGYEPTGQSELIGRTRFYCRDPFGNLLELCEIR